MTLAKTLIAVVMTSTLLSANASAAPEKRIISHKGKSGLSNNVAAAAQSSPGRMAGYGGKPTKPSNRSLDLSVFRK